MRLSVLRREPETKAMTVLVEFPPGWGRAESGSYEAAEEIVVLAGGFRMKGVEYKAGHWAYFPAGSPRWETSAGDGALSLARFSGPARWTPISGPTSDRPSARPVPLAGRPLTDSSPLDGGRGSLLRAGAADSAWLIDPPPAGEPSPVDAELLDVDHGAWALVPKGERFPELAGPCFCRVFHV